MNYNRLNNIAAKMYHWQLSQDKVLEMVVSKKYALIEFYKEFSFDRETIDGLMKIAGRNYLTDYQVGISSKGVNIVKLAIFKPDGNDVEELEGGQQ